MSSFTTGGRPRSAIPHARLGRPMGHGFMARRYHRGAGPSVLVIAPHPDDDAIGCGGTLLRLAARGVRIAVTYVTDGGASHPKSKRFPPGVLRVVRESEARAALRRLGIRTEPQFLRAPDSGLAQLDAHRRQRLVDAVAARIGALRARVVFAPWLRDPHADHVATAEIVQAAILDCARRPAIYWYGVWLPVRGLAADQPEPGEIDVIDVRLTAGELARKRAAIMEHRSQLGLLIDDDPDGFCIDPETLATWLTPIERFYRAASPTEHRQASRYDLERSLRAGLSREQTNGDRG